MLLIVNTSTFSSYQLLSFRNGAYTTPEFLCIQLWTKHVHWGTIGVYMNTSQHNPTHALYDTLFTIGMWWRVVYGALKVVASALLFRVIGTPISDLYYAIIQQELVEDPHDLFIQLATPLMHHFSMSVSYFVAVYLIFWGVIDIVLSISLLKKKLWAFPVSIVIIILFVLYECYRLSHTHSYILAGVILIDIALVVLIAKEYKNLQRNKSVNPNM